MLDRIYGGSLAFKINSVQNGKQNGGHQERFIINYERVFIKTTDQDVGRGRSGILGRIQNLGCEEDEEIEDEISKRGDEEGLPMIQALLKQYEDIFETTRKLPQKKAIDHRILKMEGQKPINVRPHKYGHIQKAKIEKLVMEMMQVK